MRPSDVSILIVDDVIAVRSQVTELLAAAGFTQVKSAVNGVEARMMLESEPFQLAIVDWKMAPLDGVELCRFVRSHKFLKSLPFVMLTAETTKEKVIEAIKAGIDDYIVKPMTPDVVKTKIFGLLLKKQVI